MSALQDMPLMKMATVFLVHPNLDLSSMPMEDVSVMLDCVVEVPVPVVTVLDDVSVMLV